MLKVPKDKTVALLRSFYGQLEQASKGNLSTADITPNRLFWEVINKIFTILVTCENSLTFKDSLAAHLVARYTYEMFVIVVYVFLDKSKTQERAEQFLKFNQFKNTERAWSDKTFAQMLKDLPDNSRFAFHTGHYRNLSNFAHPTMNSFLLNRMGAEVEFSMTINTVLLTLNTILEIVKICFAESTFFSDEQKAHVNLAKISEEIDTIMAELKSSTKN